MAEQEQQREPLYTLTVEITHQKTSPEWFTTGAATDTLAHLAEWAAPANPEIKPPEAPLTTETVRQFVTAPRTHGTPHPRNPAPTQHQKTHEQPSTS